MSFTEANQEASDILDRLKQGTQVHHHSIENAIPVMRDDLTPEAYLKILKRFYGFHKTFEENLRRYPALQMIVADFPQRQKLHLLKEDLAFLGVEEESQHRLPILLEGLPINSIAEVLGSMYVMEGSTLGGQLISKHLQDLFGMKPQLGASYYNAYGDRTGKMWQSFKNSLKAYVKTPEQKSDAVHGAQRTFTCLQNWMTK